MKRKRLHILASVLMAGSLVLTSAPVTQFSVSAASNSYETVDNPTLRDYADPSVSFVGYGMGAENFADQDMGSFWNGHSDTNLATSSQWMMYDFGERQAEVKGCEIQFYEDGGGVRAPQGIKVETSLDGTNWTEVTAKGDWTIAKNAVTKIAFEPVTMSKIRVTMVHTESDSGEKVPVAVNDWKLIGDIPDSFPKPTAVTPEEDSEDLTLPDAAVYAIPSSDYTSDWENVNGINNADFNPTNSNIGTGYGWGNWPQDPGSSHWLQYDWPEEITTKTFQVYWYGDTGGMKVPTDVGFQYKDADGNWKDATLVSNPKNFSKFGKYNQITIEEITTKSIRMNMKIAAGGNSCGVYRWKVYSKLSDDFVVSAAANNLMIPEIREGRVASRICKSLTLPKSSELDSTIKVSWKSGNPDVISDDGKITPPAKDTKVKMTVTCEQGSISKSRDIEFMVLSDSTTEYALTIDQANRGVDISQELFGIFYEDINSAADGGLSTELVKNNSFENYQNMDSATAPEVFGDQNSWKLHWKSSNASNFTVERTDGLNDTNKNYAKITGNMTLSNHGFVEKAKLDQSAMGITEGKEYAFSTFMKADSSYSGTVKVKVVDDQNNALTNEAVIDLKKDGSWQKVFAKLKATTTRLGTIVLTFEGAKDTDVIYLDMVSLIPTDSYGYGDKNYSYGAGLRTDLVQMLKDLNPSFIRFPGGCVIEGSYGTENYYNWEDSVGPLEERRAIASYWGTSGHPETGDTPNYGYMMSYQFGYHEILKLCEDLGAEPFPILSAGIFCQFRKTANAFTPDTGLEKFAQHATHLLDYCWGNPLSSDATESYWANKRVENGHEEPFDLNYLGIGNENWGETYYSNYEWIKDYVETYAKDHYPDQDLTLISSTGAYYQGGQNTEGWSWINKDMPGETLVDEHYYINYSGDGGNTLLNGDYAYDNYKRLDEGGSEVFIGEYAGHLSTAGGENVLDTAISEAAYMTGIERNADIVRHASYAPLFEKEGCRDWNFNLIKFNAYNVYGTPNYYVQKMYSNNYGDHIINTTLEKYNSDTSKFDKLAGHQTELYYITSEDDDYIYTKLVNHNDFSKEITLNYPGLKDGTKVELITLAGNGLDKNTMLEPEKIAPVTTEATLKNEKLMYEVPAMSLTVLKVSLNGENQAEDVAKEVKEAKEKISTVITAAETKKQSSYTADSWAEFTKALNQAKAVSAKADATAQEIAEAQAALEKAISGLKAVSASTEIKAPAGVRAVWNGGKKVTISWTKSTGAASYNVYRTYKKGGALKKIATVKGTSYQDTKAEKTAYYVVSAVKDSKEVKSSAIAVVVLSTPTGVKAKGASKKVTISFKKVSGAKGYEIFKSAKKKKGFKKLASLKASKVKLTKKMKKGTYYFKVRAYRIVSGKKVYTSYSKVVKAKVKK